MRSSETSSKPAALASATASAARPGVWTRSSVRSTCGTADCMPNDIRVKPPSRSAASDSGVTDSGFASVVTSAPSVSPNVSRIAPSSVTNVSLASNVGVPPPTNTLVTVRGPSTRCARAISPSAAATYEVWDAPGAAPSSAAVYVLKSQYPHRLAQNGTWTYMASEPSPAVRADAGSDPSSGTGSPSGSGPATA